jgi:hypothetical protein
VELVKLTEIEEGNIPEFMTYVSNEEEEVGRRKEVIGRREEG